MMAMAWVWMALLVQDTAIFTWEGPGEVKAVALGRSTANPVITFLKPNGALTLVVNGKMQGEYLEISPVKVSDDGQAFVTTVRGSAGFQIVTQAGPGATISEVFQQGTAISADGKHYAVSGRKPSGAVVLIDGTREVKVSGPVTEIVFHPNGTQLAISCDDGLTVAGVDGSITKEIPGGRYPVWSPDGKRFGYIHIKGLEYRVVIDGKESPTYNTARFIVFSPDGKRCAWIAQDQPASAPPRKGRPAPPPGKSMLFAVVDFQPQKPFASVREFAFSQDGKEFSYFGQAEEGKPFTLISSGKVGSFSSQLPRGLHYAGSDRAFISRDAGQDSVYHGDQKVGSLKLVTDFVFSGSKVHWIGANGNEWFFGSEKSVHAILPGTLRAESGGVSYLARTSNSVVRVVR
jgi:hypothetical protein